MYNPAHPGQVFADGFLEGNMTITEAAAKLGISRKTLSAIVNGRAPISAITAIKLHDAFGGPSAEMWLRMQASYDLWQARQKLEKQAA
jgi:addiction module HigA family antidote